MMKLSIVCVLLVLPLIHGFWFLKPATKEKSPDMEILKDSELSGEKHSLERRDLDDDLDDDHYLDDDEDLVDYYDGEIHSLVRRDVGVRCVDSCENNRTDGDYQSCSNCSVYATCLDGRFYGDRPCPSALVWDDNDKECNYTSTTCNCVESCINLPTGDYQSCSNCSVYVSCVSGNMYDNRPCPAELVWDDDAKGCRHNTTTC